MKVKKKIRKPGGRCRKRIQRDKTRNSTHLAGNKLDMVEVRREDTVEAAL